MKGRYKKFAALIERVAREVAPRFGCAVAESDGMVVLRDEYRDAFTVALRCKGMRGRQHIVTSFDVTMAQHDDVAVDFLLRHELEQAARRLSSLVVIPMDVPVVELGQLCLVHRPDFEDDKKPWPRMDSVDFDRWVYSCNVDPTNPTLHDMPDRVACVSHDEYGIRERP